MKKFLSIFIALAMVLSLFAGVGARTAKAAAITAATITGTARVGAVLTAAATGSTVTPTFAWQSTVAGGAYDSTYATIAGATAATYTPVAGDVGKYIEVVATAGTGDTGSATSAYTQPVTPTISTASTIAYAAVNPPVVVTLVGDTFTAAAGTLGGWDFTGTHTAGLTPFMVTLNSPTAVTITFTGTAVEGTQTIQATAEALSNPYPLTSNTLSVVVPAATPPTTINIAAIPGVTAPVTGATPVTVTTATAQYTGAVIWSGAPVAFAATTAYTATITLTPTTGYTLTGVAANFFTVAGATATNAASSGVVTALFPATAVAPVRTLQSISITPNPANILINTAQQFVVTGTYNIAPLTADLTASAVWSTNAPNGYFVGMTAGQFAVTASNGGFNSFAVVNVTSVVTTITTTTTTAGTLTLTPAGNFVGGVDGSGALGVDAIGTVVNVTDSTHAVVDVTTAGVGTFDTVNGITVLHNTGVTSIDTDWATTGMKSISFTGSITSIFNVGDTIKVAGSSTKGVGKVISINAAGTLAVVNVTTAVVGTIGPKVYTTSYADSTDLDWLTAGTAQPITFDAAVTLAAGDILDVAMLQAVPGTSATAFLIVSGTPVKGDIATVTWQDTLGASHTVSYTTVTGDTAASVALALSQLIHALDLTTGNVDATVAGNLITLTQDVAGVAGNGKKLTATSTAAVTPTLTIHTVGGLNSPAYVELGKTIKLVAVDATGAVVSCTWTSVGSAAPAGPSAVVNTSGLVTADLALTGVTVVTATSGSATGVFAVVVIPVQLITSLKINLVPAVPVSTTVQQFGAIASNAAYSALDYTTQAVWTDALPVASIAATTGLLTYSTDETGNVFASAGGITATANVKIATGVATLPPVVGPVTKVIVLTIGSDIVTVDGKATTVDSPPAIVAGRTFVPIRFIAETFGSTVTWLPDTKGVTIVLGDTTIGLQIGNATAVINGTIIALEAAPYINPDADRTMVPLRVISESFGGNVAWDPINHIITITYVLPVVLPAA